MSATVEGGGQAPERVLKQVLLYLPVIHAGYEALLERHADAGEVLLLGRSFQEAFPVLRKEIRALSPERAALYLRCGLGGVPVLVVEREQLPGAIVARTLVVPDEDVLRELVRHHGLERRCQVLFERTFLRWDADRSREGRPAAYDGKVATDEVARRLLAMAAIEARHSSDWWRQVGAVAARDGEVLATAHNRHYPTEYAPYLDGDPRNNFSRGVGIELSTALHAEAALVAGAARSGMRLDGADIYVSTFPCPGCARLIAQAGFRRCYFAAPYSRLDGDEVLRKAGVELIWVEPADPPPVRP